MHMIQTSIHSRLALLLVATAGLSLPSCSERDLTEQPVFPVTGSVLVRDQPAENALVVFHPLGQNAGENLRPSGRVEADGTFTLESYRTDDGAPAGEYAVTVVWPEEASGPMPDPDLAPDRLRGRYANPQESSLRVSVAAEENHLPPFDLK